MKQTIEDIVEQFEIKGAIFDLDGTMLDNNPYHLRAWKKYLEQKGRKITDEEYNANINGRTNKDVIRYLFGAGLADDETLNYSLEKEAVYRELYRADIKPVNGLIDVLEFLQERNIPMAIATSGIQVNIDFMFEHVPVRKYFRAVVNSSHIKKGKPDPEIFLRAATELGIPAKHCLVFEDSVVGVNAAHAAGMKVVALSTTQSGSELRKADITVMDFASILP
jgi:beta-phosphoglucomutase family hydrolase